MLSVITALNVAYDVRDPRPWWRVRLVALGLTVVFALFTLGALVLLVLGLRLAGMLADRVGMGPRLLTAWSVLEWPVAAAAVVTGIALVYYLAPAVEQRWHWVTPGSVFALAAWLAASAGLRHSVRSVGGYNATYDSVGGVILLLLWLYLTGAVLRIGAEINAEIEHAAAGRGARTAKATGERAPGELRSGNAPRTGCRSR